MPVWADDPLSERRGTRTPGLFLVREALYATELCVQAAPTGLEPATSALTGQRSNQLSYDTRGPHGGTRSRTLLNRGFWRPAATPVALPRDELDSASAAIAVASPDPAE
jgi:hypothetical protein